MTIVHELDVLEQVRALSEHRAPKRVLRTVPFVADYRAPRARVSFLPPPSALMSVPAEQRRASTGTMTLAAAMEKFQRTAPGDFTTTECAEFMLAAGWRVQHPQNSAAGKLRKMYFADEIEEVGREGAEMVWRFKQPKEVSA